MMCHLFECSRLRQVLVAACLLLGLWGVGTAVVHALFNVSPTSETAPHTRFDDPAIWIHPTDPAQSIIIGANKNYALVTYNLDGSLLQDVYPNTGYTAYNNVDLRYRFPLNGELIDIAVVTQRSASPYSIDVYKIDPATRMLTDITGSTSMGGVEPYGIGLYHDQASGKFYAFVTSNESPYSVRQYELTGNASGTVDATLVRTLNNFGSLAEGVVVDDYNGVVYIGEEEVGIYKYDADPTAPITRSTVALIGQNGLTADTEGMTIYYTNPDNCSGSSGYLLVSSQGNSTFHIYSRDGNNAFIDAFAVVDHATNGVDGLSSTDGIDVTNVNLAPYFPDGFFIGHDDNDVTPSGSGENFKMVSWADIASSASLCVDQSWHPRIVPPTLTIAANPVVLDWTDDNVSSCYLVYRSTTPYFAPDAITLHMELGPAPTLPQEVADSAPADRFFYIVRAQNCDGSLPQDSNEVGEFRFDLVPGSS